MWIGALPAAPAWIDRHDMSFLDETPGGFIAVANLILYGVVGVEIWMLTSASMAAMIATLALIIGVAALLCRWMNGLLSTESPMRAVEAPVETPVETPAQREPQRRPAPAASRRGIRGVPVVR
jgi:hypothetical protein